MATLIERVAAHVAARPDAPAVRDVAREVSYAELWAEVDVLAPQLEGRGVVAIDRPPSVEAIVALLAAHRAGCAFLFLDRQDPEVRRRAIVAATEASVLGEVLVPGDARVDPDLAYLVSSSGSTGRPKVVRVGHRGLVPMLDAQVAAFRLRPRHRVLLGTPLRFDASVSDLGCALVAGACLCIPPRRDRWDLLTAFVRAHHVTHADLPPAAMAALDPWPGLEVVVVGGEVVPASVLRRWARRARVFVSYGPSEATVCTSLAEVDAERWDGPSIGRPLPHVQYRCVDGELWIGGTAVALGYVDGDEGRFVEGWFRTGDRVRAEADGTYTFLGRVDRQAKIDGRLFCPEELEAGLVAHPPVREAAVVIREGRPVSFVAPRVDEVALREALGHLPAAWTSQLVFVEELPRGPTGKVDHGRLEGVAPGGERGLCGIIGRLLGRSVGWDDDLVALGATSRTALELVAAAAVEGWTLPVDALFTGRTPRGIEARARRAVWTAATIEARCVEHRSDATGGAGGGILFTGTTGRFGGRLLAAWLRRSEREAWALIRAPSDTAARARLDAVWAELGLPSRHRSRVRAVAGDLSRARCGWSEERVETMGIGEVVHAAASLDLTAPWASMETVNLRGTAEVARLGRLHLVSTLAVLLAADGAPAWVDEAVDARTATQLHGAYAASKWGAERLGVASNVFRLGLLSGGHRDAVSSLVRGVAELGCAPRCDEDALRFDLTPIDLASEAVAELIAGEASGVWQVSSRRGASWAALRGAMEAEGHRVEVVALETFEARAQRELSLDVAWSLLAWGARLRGEPRLALDPFLLTGRTLDPTRTERRSGVVIDDPSHHDLRRFVRHAMEGA